MLKQCPARAEAGEWLQHRWLGYIAQLADAIRLGRAIYVSASHRSNILRVCAPKRYIDDFDTSRKSVRNHS